VRQEPGRIEEHRVTADRQHDRHALAAQLLAEVDHLADPGVEVGLVDRLVRPRAIASMSRPARPP
jgi:hypothetical protein